MSKKEKNELKKHIILNMTESHEIIIDRMMKEREKCFSEVEHYLKLCKNNKAKYLNAKSIKKLCVSRRRYSNIIKYINGTDNPLNMTIFSDYHDYSADMFSLLDYINEKNTCLFKKLITMLKSDDIKILFVDCLSDNEISRVFSIKKYNTKYILLNKEKMMSDGIDERVLFKLSATLSMFILIEKNNIIPDESIFYEMFVLNYMYNNFYISKKQILEYYHNIKIEKFEDDDDEFFKCLFEEIFKNKKEKKERLKND